MRFLNTSKRKDALKCQKINSNAALQLLCNGARQMKDLKGKLIWICKGDFKEPNASCQAPRCHASCRHSRLPNVSNTCPGGCSLAVFLPWWLQQVGRQSFPSAAPFFGGVPAIQESFSKDNHDNPLLVFLLQLTKACKRFTGENCCQQKLLFYLPKRTLYIYHI